MLQHAFQLAYGLLGIAMLIAFDALCLYALWWLVLWLVSYVPMVGQRHKHDRWDELNGPATSHGADEPGRSGPVESPQSVSAVSSEPDAGSW